MRVGLNAFREALGTTLTEFQTLVAEGVLAPRSKLLAVKTPASSRWASAAAGLGKSGHFPEGWRCGMGDDSACQPRVGSVCCSNHRRDP